MSARRLVFAAAALALALAAVAPASAASYIRFEGVDGEFVVAPSAPAGTRGHEGSKGWIEVGSVQFGPTTVNEGTLRAAPPVPPARTGGVRVAGGDIDGNSAPAAGLTKVGPGTLVLSGAMAGCRVGARYPAAEVRQGAAGRLIKLEGVVVRSCASESFSLNYAKVSW